MIVQEVASTPNLLLNIQRIVHDGTILEATEEDWDYSFDVNVKSMFHFIQAFLPQVGTTLSKSLYSMLVLLLLCLLTLINNTFFLAFLLQTNASSGRFSSIRFMALKLFS